MLPDVQEHSQGFISGFVAWARVGMPAHQDLGERLLLLAARFNLRWFQRGKSVQGLH